ncbi:MAG: hypothetical protein R8G01_01310 [Ilumatobacteraceae bacterium]|uniref:hypothetical protein n=1 Tax=Ilumatobacter fluminis TaxID=467091 RepID=UPI002967F6EB|nr:hypothetical protein [Ilumatobacteraceae bacterium]
MAYFDSLVLDIRLRDGTFVGTGEILKEHRVQAPEELGTEVSLDALNDSVNDFVSEVFLRDEHGLGLSIYEAPQAISWQVESSVFSQGGDGAGVNMVIELLHEKSWDLFVAMFGAWLWEHLGSNDDSDE